MLHADKQAHLDSVAQQIERVSAASAVPPPNHIFTTENVKLVHSHQIYPPEERLLERRLQSSYEAQRRWVQFTWMSVQIRPESKQSKASPRGLMDKASVSEAEDCGFESRRGYTQLQSVDELHWCGVQTSNL